MIAPLAVAACLVAAGGVSLLLIAHGWLGQAEKLYIHASDVAEEVRCLVERSLGQQLDGDDELVDLLAEVLANHWNARHATGPKDLANPEEFRREILSLIRDVPSR